MGSNYWWKFEDGNNAFMTLRNQLVGKRIDMAPNQIDATDKRPMIIIKKAEKPGQSS